MAAAHGDHISRVICEIVKCAICEMCEIIILSGYCCCMCHCTFLSRCLNVTNIQKSKRCAELSGTRNGLLLGDF